MSKESIGLLITFILGLFILLGAIIAIVVGKKKKIIEYSLGLALGVIVTLIITDLLPEVIENLKLSKIYIGIIGLLVGYVLLKLLDYFIPDHGDESHSKNETQNNLIHIGIITSVALIIHNIIEGMAVYSSMLSSTKLGLALTLGVGFHNIPLGIVIGGAFYQSNNDKYKSILNILIV